MSASVSRFVLACVAVGLVAACQGGVPGLASALDPLSKSFNDTTFTLESCEITPDRSAVCQFSVVNRFRDKKLEIDRRITIQDDTGTDHAVTAGGFGDASARPQWGQVAVADSTYRFSVVATNLSTQARKVRAVVFTRLLVRSTQGQALGYRDQAIFANPPMRTAAAAPPALAPPSPGGPDPLPADRWHTIGYWDYDGRDGQSIPEGLVLREIAGGGAGQTWSWQLELRNHASLPARARRLWPVRIHTGEKRVCADYPNYPSYVGAIDAPGEAHDGVYQFAQCSGR